MLECRACLWRCLRAICSDSPAQARLGLTNAPKRQAKARVSHSAIRSRNASSLSTSRASKPRPSEKDNSIIKAVKSQPLGSIKLPEGPSPSQLRRLKLELPWLSTDRVKLHGRVRSLLDKDRETEALELCKMGSKNFQCTTSWNAVLEHLLSKGKVNEAFKVYNDMKKRAQVPDSYTYVALFNGLAANPKAQNTRDRALRLWQSLSNPNSKIPSSILLTNAALKACAAAGETDSLWAIAGAIPEEGAEAANSITYTTILNAMRYGIELSPREEATEEQRMLIDTTVAQARRIWVDIMRRWTSAQLIVDEDLVCAMGRILLAGVRPQDWDDVMSLCAQTMQLRREAPRLQRRTQYRSSGRQNNDAAPPPYGQSMRTTLESPGEGLELSTDFDPVVFDKPIWVEPSNQTLTMLIEATHKMFLVQAARNYWTILTEQSGFGIAPDSASFHAYLRLLRQAKASAEAVALVRDDMAKEPALAKTYRIAMSTCVRNQMSPNVMREASELMDVMLQRLRVVDVKVGIMYMKLAIQSPHPQDILVALNYMTPKRTRLRDLLDNGSSTDKDALLELSKLVVGGFDRVIRTKSLPESIDGANFEQRKATWTYAVQRLLGGGDRVKPVYSEEETILMAKKRKLLRYERIKQMDRVRAKRTIESLKRPAVRRTEALPTLESDLTM